MLTFFRRLRKSFLASGAASKYLLYAIGEIVLVVIGILIALQINNWNVWRKERIVEREILQDLSVNIQRNIEILQEGMQVLELQNESSTIIIHAIENKQTYSDSLDVHFWNATLKGIMQGILTHDGFEAYKNAGFNIIQSDSLKNRIINLFEVVYKSEAEIISLYRENSDHDDLWRKNFMVSRLKTGPHTTLNQNLPNQTSSIVKTPEGQASNLRFSYKPINYQSLVQDNEMLFAFHQINFGRNWLFQSQVDCVSESQKVLQLITEELRGTDTH